MKKVIREIVSWIIVLVIALVLGLFLRRFVMFTASIPSPSMENTILVGDRVVVSRLSYLFSEPERGDVIVFAYPDNESVDYIKRVIGLPGDEVEGIDGIVYVNGEPLEEAYVKEELDDDFGPYKVPEDSYFMMGDNRNNSEDSRLWTNTYLSQDKIKGKAILKLPDFAWLN